MQAFAESRLVRALILLVALLLVSLSLGDDKPNSLDRPLYDWAARTLIDPVTARSDVVWLDVDDQSLHDLGEQWPLQRTTWAKMLRTLAVAKPAVIAVDAWFPEPAPREAADLAQSFADRLRQTPELAGLAAAATAAADLEAEATARDVDRVLTQALAEAQVVVLGVTEAERAGDALVRSEQAALPTVVGIVAPEELAMQYREPRMSLPAIAVAARTHGALHVPFDVDSVVRRYPLVGGAKDHAVASLALAALQVARPAQAAQFGATAAQLDHGMPLLRYPKVTDVTRVRLSDLLAATAQSPILTGALRDKIVFVGVSALGASDRRSTPLRTDLPGTLVHIAGALDLLGDAALVTGGPLALAGLVTAYLLVLLVYAVTTRQLPYWALLAIGLGSAAAWAGVLQLGISAGVLLPAVPVWSALLWVMLAEMALRAATSEAGKRRIREAFAHYLAPAVVEQLVRDPDRLRLGGERRTITAFFSDVRGFTTVAEQLDPHDLVALLNECLGAMTDIILEEGGTIDKYIGDAIVAMFGAPFDQPDHALRACRAALRCQARLVQLRAKWAQTGKPELHVRIGLNSGVALVGNIGSAQRFDYSMMGDTVNLAARLEGANTVYGTGILCGEQTAQAVGPQAVLREIDLVRVKGKQIGVRVYEVVGLPGDNHGAIHQLLIGYTVAMRHMRAREFAKAHDMFAQLAQAGDPASAAMAARVLPWVEAPPGNEWDGSYQLTTK